VDRAGRDAEVIAISLVLLVAALVLLFLAAFGVVHQRVQFVPLALALVLLSHLLSSVYPRGFS
jgi:hypothetical protein